VTRDMPPSAAAFAVLCAAAYVGEVSYANWGNRYKGQPDPPRRRSLEKFVKVR